MEKAKLDWRLQTVGRFNHVRHPHHVNVRIYHTRNMVLEGGRPRDKQSTFRHPFGA